MKFLFAAVLYLWSFMCYSQKNHFELEGLVVDSLQRPVEDTYIINFRTQYRT